ncbi:bromodomain-containing protein 8-like [Pollicipes pollicipes]|uniref:bromodomain-containing protein 8-like n=1 Tax=Pollicipes pollicipes TaxID=41117 RepID=UPI0018849FCA|nr:bromodomain-containing protein 8-like [Pollicipes pollicipes]
MAAGTPSRLALKQTPLDTWSTREHLALASAVLRSGDQNWVSVSRAMRGFADAGRPSDWLSQKNCAQQYARLLELVDAPKRKRERGEPNETPGEHIVRRLRQDRTEELRRLVAEKRAAYLALKQQISQLRSGQLDSQLDDIQRQIQAEKEAAALEEERRRQRLAEREAQKVAVQQALRAQVTKAPPPKRRKLTPERRDSSLSEAGSASEPEFAEDSATSDAVAAEASGDEASREGADSRPAPSSPLLTSLLRSPSASSAGSPTLSRLLELPPAAPGYPLPRLNLFPDQAARDGEATAAEKPAAEKVVDPPSPRLPPPPPPPLPPPEASQPAVAAEMEVESEPAPPESAEQGDAVADVHAEPAQELPAAAPEAPAEQATQAEEVEAAACPPPPPPGAGGDGPAVPSEPAPVIKQEPGTEGGAQEVAPPQKSAEPPLPVVKEERDEWEAESSGSRQRSGSAGAGAAAAQAESVPNSPASAVLSGDDAEERRDYRIWKKSILILWREFTAHRHASMFARPITNDQATNYREIVKHPMDLAQMKRNVEAGTVNTTLQFQRDLMLMFCNAMMFNSSDHEVHRFAREMQAECVEKIQMLLLADKQTSQRRETRESSRDDLKRKRSGDERPTPTRKRR